MNNNALQDIQRALNTIRTETELADTATKWAVLELMLSTSSSIVALAKKISAPKSKPQKAKADVKAPAPKPLATQQNQPTALSTTMSEPKSLQAIRPQPPLPNQQDN